MTPGPEAGNQVTSDAFAIVPAVPDRDYAFVYDTWLESFKRSPWAGPYPMDLYFGVCRETIARLLARPFVRVAVATVVGAPEMLHGHVVFEPPGKHGHVPPDSRTGHRTVCGAPSLVWI